MLAVALDKTSRDEEQTSGPTFAYSAACSAFMPVTGPNPQRRAYTRAPDGQEGRGAGLPEETCLHADQISALACHHCPVRFHFESSSFKGNELNRQRRCLPACSLGCT